MAIFARAEITLAAITDVSETRRYYLLQASTLGAPSVPTTNPPGGSWVTVEPTYIEGSTNSLYTVDLTVFSNATFSYTPVSQSSSYEAAKVAYNKAFSAESTAVGTASRGTDLVVNGTGLLKNNTNFSSFVFDQTDAPTGLTGSFTRTGGSTTLVNDELIPIDPGKQYIQSVWARETVEGKLSKAYFGLSCYDSFGLSITPLNYMYRPGTLTELTQPLNPGDTVVHVASTANWANNAGASSHWRTILWWDYTDPGGKLWPPETYSRNVFYTSTTGIYDDGALTETTIPLRVAYAGPAKPLGTKLSNGGSGGTYLYTTMSNVSLPNVWTRYVSPAIGGLHEQPTTPGANPTAATTRFPPGTAAVRLLWLANYTGSDAGTRQAYAGISFSDASAAYQQATTALTAANGRNSIIRSINDASGTTNPSTGLTNLAGDVWWKMSTLGAGGQVTAQWTYDGSAWRSSTLAHQVIASVDAAKITTGTLDVANRVAANSVAAEKVLLSGANFVPNPEFNVITGWTAANATATLSDVTRGRGVYLSRANTAERTLTSSEFKVSGDVVYTVGATVLAQTATGAAPIKIQIVPVSNAGADQTPVTIATCEADGVWRVIRGQYTVPATSIRGAKFRFVGGATTATTGNDYLIQPHVTMAATAEMYVDGSITAAKIKAGELEVAGAITVGGTNQVTATQLDTTVDEKITENASSVLADERPVISQEISEAANNALTVVSTNYVTSETFNTERTSLDGAITAAKSEALTAVDTAKSELAADIDAIDGILKNQDLYITLSPSEGIVLGQVDSEFKVQITNTEMAFLQAGQKVAYVSNNQLYITDAEIKNNLALGTPASGFFDFIPRENGNLSFKFRS